MKRGSTDISVVRNLQSLVQVTNQINNQSSRFNPDAVKDVPTKGPNCYFAALTANDLLKVPAVTISDNAAAILFLNPALCTAVENPQPGDIGLEEKMSAIAHVFTFLGPNRRFEKAGPLESDKFTFTNSSSASANRFVRCFSMQKWVDDSIRHLPGNLKSLDGKISHIESILDVRSGPKSQQKFLKLQKAFEELDKSIKDADQRLQSELSKDLTAKGISKTPFPGMMNGDYYEFAKEHPALLKEPKIFALMWTSLRLREARNSLIYYNMD